MESISEGKVTLFVKHDKDADENIKAFLSPKYLKNAFPALNVHDRSLKQDALDVKFGDSLPHSAEASQYFFAFNIPELVEKSKDNQPVDVHIYFGCSENLNLQHKQRLVQEIQVLLNALGYAADD